MFRAIAKWYISRAMDCNRDLPGWVERRLRRDPILSQFYDQSQRLASRLRSTEPTCSDLGASINAVSSHRVEVTRSNSAAVRFATLAIGLAAVALIAFAPFFYRFTSDTKSYESDLARENASTVSDPVTLANAADVPTDSKRLDSERLKEMIASSRSLMERLKQGAYGSNEPALDSSLQQLAALADLEVDQVIKPISDLGTSYGELLSKLDQHVEDENRRIISDGVGAWNFMVSKLPKSAASLAGL